MEAYNNLVNQILSFPVLAKYISDTAASDNYLNLATPIWKDRLENYVIYQDYKNNCSAKFRDTPTISKNKIFQVQKLKDNDEAFRVLLITRCSFPRVYEKKEEGNSPNNFPVLIYDSAPLQMICKVMTKDFDTTHIVDDCSRVFFNCCSILSCNKCNITAEKFEIIGYKVPHDSQPCILHTKVFDGRTIVNRFGSQLKEMFPSQGIAIIAVELHTRYTYSQSDTMEKKIRVGGNGDKLLVFRESNLSSTETVFLGDLKMFQDNGRKVVAISPQDVGSNEDGAFLSQDNEFSEEATYSSQEKDGDATMDFLTGFGETGEEVEVHNTLKRKLKEEDLTEEVDEIEETAIIECLPAAHAAKKPFLEGMEMTDYDTIDCEEDMTQLFT